jgi:hypothetical protein
MTCNEAYHIVVIRPVEIANLVSDTYLLASWFLSLVNQAVMQQGLTAILKQVLSMIV